MGVNTECVNSVSTLKRKLCHRGVAISDSHSDNGRRVADAPIGTSDGTSIASVGLHLFAGLGLTGVDVDGVRVSVQ